MDYNVTDISPVETKIDVNIPVEEVNAALAVTTAMYRQNLDLRGFRKGKVPSSIVEAKYRKQIMRESANDLMNVHINEIMSTLKYLAIAKLDINPVELELEKDQPLSYSISFEHAPVIELPEYKGLAVDEEEAQASEEEIAQVLERIRNNLADLKPILTDRMPADGDVVVVSFHAEENGVTVPGIRAENFQLSLGEKQALPEFEELVKNTMPGQTATSKVTFPDDFLNASLAGKTVDMTITVHIIKERQLPPLDDELAKKAGNFENLEKMRQAISMSYVQSRQQLYKAAAQKQLLDQLIGNLEIPLPPSLVAEQLENLIASAQDKLERMGKAPEAVGNTREELEKEYAPKASEMVKSQLFLLNLAEKEGIETTPQEMDGYFTQVASRTGQDLLAVKQHYEQNNLIIPVRDKILADKAMDFIYSHATVTKIPAKEVAALA